MYKKSKLKNGVRVIIVPITGTSTVTIMVIVGTGSKNEIDSNRGISHFLEHMFFKGTKKRPTTLDLSKELDKVGGIYNAFTGKEFTGFWAKVDSSHSDLALDVISDMLLNSKFSKEEIDKERGTIIEEMNMYFDNPIMHVPSLFENLLYDNQSLGFDEVGNKETINSVTRKDFTNYYKKYYTGENIIIVASGNLSENNIRKRISKYFSVLNNRNSGKQSRGYDKQEKPGIALKQKNTDQTHLCLGVRGYYVEHRDKYALGVLSTILGGNMSSRLFISVREREGLAYYIHTTSEEYKDVGYLVTQAGVSNEKCERAIEIILNEYKKLKTEIVGNEELKKAKDYLKGRTMISLESSDAMASFVATQEMYAHKILTPKEKFAKIDAVTSDDILRVANDIFIDCKLNLALIGPFKNKKIFEDKLSFSC